MQFFVKSEKIWVRKLGKQGRKMRVKNDYLRQDFETSMKSQELYVSAMISCDMCDGWECLSLWKLVVDENFGDVANCE